MSHHVGIGEIENDQIVIRHAGEHLSRDQGRAHFRLQIVGGNFRRWHNLSVFSGESPFDAAVKKVSHMRVLFRLSNAQLRFASSADHLTEDMNEFFGSEDERRRISHIVLRERHEINLGPKFTIETIKILQQKCLR